MIAQSILSRNCLSWRLGIPRESLEDLALDAVRNYHPFSLRLPGKKPRLIDNPSPRLRDVQRKINQGILKKLEFPAYLHGGIKGRSSRTNASMHLGRSLVVRLDLEDFFPSVTDQQVYSVWRALLGCSESVASLLTTLTTYRGRLPQGAPTSSLIANLVLRDADLEIKAAAVRVGCSFTRYVDDLIFSGDRSADLISDVLQILCQSGFRVSRGKLALMPGSTLQEVTGLSVNSRQGPSVPRYRRDQIRAAIHGLKDVSVDAGFHREVESIRGRISHVASTNPGSARSLLRYLEVVIMDKTSQA